MAKAQYDEEQFKNFGDFYAYTDVFDWHYVNILEWKNGIALVELENGKAIFNGHKTIKLTSSVKAKFLKNG